jgi:DNA-binding GntR family transcriptional regulator
MSYMSEGATAFDARHLECEEATPLLVLYRETFSEAGRITRVRLAHAPGHVVRLQI